MDVKEFIKDNEELKDIDVENINEALDIFNHFKEEEEEQDKKLYRLTLSLEIIRGFESEYSLHDVMLNNKEVELDKKIIETYDKLKDLLGELILESADGDKELARKYL